VGRLTDREFKKTRPNLLLDDGGQSSQARNDVLDGEGGEVLTLAVALRHLASYRIPRHPPLKPFLEPNFWIQLVPSANRSPFSFSIACLQNMIEIPVPID